MVISGDPPVRLFLAFQQNFPDATLEWMAQAPGREMWAAAAVHPGDEITLALADDELRATFSFRSARFKQTVLQRPLPLWARYPAGVIVALREAGLESDGLRVVLAGDEPPGPRHDHAMGMALAALWHDLCGQPYTAESLLEIVEQVRRTYVET